MLAKPMLRKVLSSMRLARSMVSRQLLGLMKGIIPSITSTSAIALKRSVQAIIVYLSSALQGNLRQNFNFIHAHKSRTSLSGLKYALYYLPVELLKYLKKSVSGLINMISPLFEKVFL